MDWKGLVRLAISLGLLAGFLLWPDWEPVTKALIGINPIDLVVAILWLLLGYVVAAWRLQMLCRTAGMRIPPRTLGASYSMGLFFNCVLPTSVGGDAVRIIVLVRRGFPLRPLVVTGVVDRLLGFVTLGLMSGLALMLAPLWFPQTSNASLWLGALLLVATIAGCAILLVLTRGVEHWPLQSFGGRVAAAMVLYRDSLRALYCAPYTLMAALGLSVLAHILVTFSYLSCGGTLLGDFPWQGYFIAAPLVMLFQILPVSLGGLGVRELSTVGALVWLGADQSQAVAMSLAYLGVAWLSVTPGLAVAVYNGVRWQDVKRAEARNE